MCFFNTQFSTVSEHVEFWHLDHVEVSGLYFFTLQFAYYEFGYTLYLFSKTLTIVEQHQPDFLCFKSMYFHDGTGSVITSISCYFILQIFYFIFDHIF